MELSRTLCFFFLLFIFCYPFLSRVFAFCLVSISFPSLHYLFPLFSWFLFKLFLGFFGLHLLLPELFRVIPWGPSFGFLFFRESAYRKSGSDLVQLTEEVNKWVHTHTQTRTYTLKLQRIQKGISRGRSGSESPEQVAWPFTFLLNWTVVLYDNSLLFLRLALLRMSSACLLPYTLY